MKHDQMLGIFGALFFALILVRIGIVYRKTGHFPVVLATEDSAHDFVHRVIIGIVLAEALNIYIYAEQEQLYPYLVPIPYLQLTLFKWMGCAVAYAALLWTAVAQMQMGASWRVGNDAMHPTALVTHAMYARFRHPIYLGFIAITLGLFLATPNALSLVGAVLTMVVLAIQARLEEAFQLARHGDVYKDYLDRTRRWC